MCCQELDDDAQKPSMVHASLLQSNCSALLNDMTCTIIVVDLFHIPVNVLFDYSLLIVAFTKNTFVKTQNITFS